MKCNSTLFCLLFSFSLSLFTAAKAQTDVNDSLILVNLYNSTNGSDWLRSNNWLTTKPVSTWYGITVTGTRVTKIKLNNNYLTGSLPASIGNLNALTALQLWSNYIEGKIPASVINLTNLTILDLDNNKLTGTIPASIGNLVKLTQLVLNNNQLSGSIPSSVYKLLKLKDLNLTTNQLKGNIDVAIGDLVNLTNLKLDDNQLTGNIPSTIGNLTKLFYLYLNNNQLTGGIPASVGNLTKLLGLNLQNNQLSGSIPSSLGNLADAIVLHLENNQLTGSIPSSLTNMYSLRYVYLYNNQLSGTIPAFGSSDLQRQVVELYLNNNQLSGSIPFSFKNLQELSFLNLSHNQLSQDENVFYSKINKQFVNADISYNMATFDGLEMIAKKAPNTQYAPQANVPVHQHGNSLSVYAGGTLSNNTYKWYKVGQTGSTVIQGDSTYTPAKTGKYYVEITNAVATKLTLYSDTIDFTANSIIANARMVGNAYDGSARKGLQASPNPASSIVNIRVNGNASIILTNSAGKLMLSKNIANNATINVSSLANGVYYIKNKTTGEVQKIVVAH